MLCRLRQLHNQFWYFEGFTRNVRAHVIFASHSPMLLSDLPIENVVFLDNEYGKGGLNNTFGANIFDLYRLAFDQSNGITGEFAANKIKDALAKVAEVVKSRIECSGTSNAAKVLDKTGFRGVRPFCICSTVYA